MHVDNSSISRGAFQSCRCRSLALEVNSRDGAEIMRIRLFGSIVVALAIAGAATIVTYLLLLRLMAGAIIGNALGVMPVPPRYAVRLGRLLRLDPAGSR